MKYIPIECQSACNKLKRKIPYGWDLNVYRGCEHGCKYCYAIYTADYMKSNDFYEEVYVKTNIVEHLEKQLRSQNWKREVVNLGGVTDNYQPAEAQFKIMPEILKLLIRYETPAIISTKSNLALRDFDLIDELSRITYINLAATITTMDESVRRIIEPGGTESIKRFEMLKEFKKTNASLGLHVMPIIPYLTDTEENMESICRHANEVGVDYMLPGTLYLRGKAKAVFMEAMRVAYPEVYEELLLLYRTGGAGKEYKDELYKMVNRLRDKYSISKSYINPMKEKLKQQEYMQLSLFD